MAIMPLKQDKCLSQVELLGMITSRIPCRMFCNIKESMIHTVTLHQEPQMESIITVTMESPQM